MPGKDGIETLHELKKQKNNPNLNTKIVCLTANAISGSREQYLAEGFDDYMTKPIDSGKLEEMLLKYLPEEKLEIVSEEEAQGVENNDAKLPEVLKTLERQVPVNVGTGIENSGTVDAYMPLLRIFYASMNETAEEIRRFYSDGNLKDYTIKVHALKSSARIIGAEEARGKSPGSGGCGKTRRHGVYQQE